jgi:hypothetical protein
MPDSEVSCANPSCLNKIELTIHNKKYCSPECRRVVTNKRVLERYHEGKKKKPNDRRCKDCKLTVLSIYNPENVCAGCKAKKLGIRVQEMGISKQLVEEMYEIARKNQ